MEELRKVMNNKNTSQGNRSEKGEVVEIENIQKAIEDVKKICCEETSKNKRELDTMKSSLSMNGGKEWGSQGDKLKKEMEQLKTEVANIGGGVGRGEEGRKIEEIEMKLEDLEKEKRKKNVVFFNLIESDKQEPLERFNEDMDLCYNLLKNELGIPHINIVNLIRLGKRTGSSARPLLVKLGGEEDRIEILRLAKGLRHSTRFKNVFINRDMTENERESDRRLREELKEKRRADEGSSFVIRKGKVIRVEGAEEEQRYNNGNIGGARPKIRGNQAIQASRGCAGDTET